MHLWNIIIIIIIIIIMSAHIYLAPDGTTPCSATGQIKMCCYVLSH